jgi:hypothetical protein
VDGGFSASDAYGKLENPRKSPSMKTYDNKLNAAPAVPIENQGIFMILLRDSLRTAAEQSITSEAVSGPGKY